MGVKNCTFFLQPSPLAIMAPTEYNLVRMTTFKREKKQLTRTMFIPISWAIAISFSLVFLTISVVSWQDYTSKMNNAIKKNVEHLNLSLSLQISANEAIVKSPTVINYLNGDESNASAIRQTLSNKVNQSPSLIGNSLYSLSGLSLSSYSISGMPENTTFLNLSDITSFIDSEENALFFLRHQAIASSYNFVPYPPSDGLCSLVEKIYLDGDLLGMLVSDFGNDALYNNTLSFSNYTTIRVQNVHLQNESGLLYAENVSDKYTHENLKDGLNIKGLATIVYQTDLAFSYDLINNIELVLVINSRNMLFLISTLFLGFGLIAAFLIVLSKYLVNRLARKIIDPLEDINSKIKAFLE